MCYNVIYAITSYFGAHVTYGIDVIEKIEKKDTRVLYNVFKQLSEMNKQMFYNPKLFNEILNNELKIN